MQRDVIHCHDWITALIPPAARQTGIACLFAVHSLNTAHAPPACIAHNGLDAESWRQNL